MFIFTLICLLLSSYTRSQHLGNKTLLSDLLKSNESSEEVSTSTMKSVEETTLPFVTTDPNLSSNVTSAYEVAVENGLGTGSIVPRKGVQSLPLNVTSDISTSLAAVDNNSSEKEDSVESVEEDTGKNTSNKLPQLTTKPVNRKIHPLPVETLWSVSTTKAPPMKPLTVVSEAQGVSTNVVLMASTLIVLALCCFAGICYFKLIKKSMQQRHYERVDFLIEGMYDDDI